jgi:fido (protein-threonine AMPylation protein)
VSGDTERLAEKKARENREANLVANRIRELHLSPVAGVFDLTHLKAVHAHLFQDLPEHRPGVARADSDGWNKARALEGRVPSHVVRYAHEGIVSKLDGILKGFGGPGALHGLSLHTVVQRLARLYGDLDHVHGFYEAIAGRYATSPASWPRLLATSSTGQVPGLGPKPATRFMLRAMSRFLSGHIRV